VRTAQLRKAPAPPPLRPWSRIWRYLLAGGLALVAWLVVVDDLLPDDLTHVPDLVNGVIVLDLFLGLCSLALLPLRRRYPVLVAATTVAMSSASAAAFGASVLAAVSMATRRRVRGVLVVGVFWLAATLVYEVLYRRTFETTGADYPALLSWVAGGLVLAVYGICVATGFYVGARRELIANLQERAVTAEREQALRTEAAREAERTRIAREMHDVLAHRISLVALHAGALAYRADLTREETAEAAGVIRDNAHLALTELRQVLGVLRSDHAASAVPGAGHSGGSGTWDGGAGQGSVHGAGADAGAGPGHAQEQPVEPPQPTLAQIDELVAETAGLGTTVRLDVTHLPDGAAAALAELPVTSSRTAYRIIQEALTNARKHAPGAPVDVRLGGGPGGLLTVEVRNQPVAGRHEHPLGAPPPGAGVGLTGMTERAHLVGGLLEHGFEEDGSFAVRAWLPWEEDE